MTFLSYFLSGINRVTIKLTILILLVLIVNFTFAQNDTLQLLKGEWYYFEPTQPHVNDTFRLSRDKIHDSYVKWEFRENGSFYEQDITEMNESEDLDEPALIIGSILPSKWVFNIEEKTVELRDLSKVYKITGINENLLELVRLE